MSILGLGANSFVKTNNLAASTTGQAASANTQAVNTNRLHNAEPTSAPTARLHSPTSDMMSPNYETDNILQFIQDNVPEDVQTAVTTRSDQFKMALGLDVTTDDKAFKLMDQVAQELATFDPETFDNTSEQDLEQAVFDQLKTGKNPKKAQALRKIIQAGIIQKKALLKSNGESIKHFIAQDNSLGERHFAAAISSGFTVPALVKQQINDTIQTELQGVLAKQISPKNLQTIIENQVSQTDETYIDSQVLNRQAALQHLDSSIQDCLTSDFLNLLQGPPRSLQSGPEQLKQSIYATLKDNLVLMYEPEVFEHKLQQAVSQPEIGQMFAQTDALEQQVIQHIFDYKDAYLNQGHRNNTIMQSMAKLDCTNPLIFDMEGLDQLTPAMIKAVITQTVDAFDFEGIKNQQVRTQPKTVLQMNVQSEAVSSMQELFSQGLNKDTILKVSQQTLTNHFAQNKTELMKSYPGLSAQDYDSVVTKTLNTMQNAIEFVDQNNQAGYLKFNTSVCQENTLVRTPEGSFELLNSLDADQQQALIQQSNAKNLPAETQSNTAKQFKKKIVLGKGAFGKARLARHLDTGQICVVKKIFTPQKPSGTTAKTFLTEKSEAAAITDGSALVKYKGAGLVNVPVAGSTAGQVNPKGYIFMDYAGAGTAHDLTYQIQYDTWTAQTMHYDGNIAQAQDAFLKVDSTINQAAHNITLGVAQFNEQGRFHLDIKPENVFGNLETGFKLGDYGLSSTDQSMRSNQGTLAFMPPEMTKPDYDYQGKPMPHSNEKHDAFSLGATLLEISHGTSPPGGSYSLDLNGTLHELSALQNNDSLPCAGVETFDTTQLAGNTLDEVIAKLMDANPENRISSRDALELPFFKNMNS